jgi:hypothetical protein
MNFIDQTEDLEEPPKFVDKNKSYIWFHFYRRNITTTADPDNEFAIKVGILLRWTTYGEKRSGRNEKYWEVGSSIPVRNFPVDSDNFQWFPAGSVRKLSEKIRKIPGENTEFMVVYLKVLKNLKN